MRFERFRECVYVSLIRILNPEGLNRRDHDNSVAAKVLWRHRRNTFQITYLKTLPIRDLQRRAIGMPWRLKCGQRLRSDGLRGR